MTDEGKPAVPVPAETAVEDDVYEIELAPEAAEKIVQDYQHGQPLTLAIQLNELHHHYAEQSQTFPVAELGAIRDQLGAQYVDRAFTMLEKEQAAVIEDDRSHRRLQMHGLWGGIGLVVLLSLCGLIAMEMGFGNVAGIIFGFTILGALTTLVLRKLWKGSLPAVQKEEPPSDGG